MIYANETLLIPTKNNSISTGSDDKIIQFILYKREIPYIVLQKGLIQLCKRL